MNRLAAGAPGAAAAAANRLDQALAARLGRGQAALLIYITAGFPDLDVTRRLIPELFAAGADVIELGLPFSDPLADGPTIQRASHLALQRGVRVADVLDVARDARRRGVDGALVLMSYANPLLARGLLQEPRRLAEAGFDGLIVPDVPSLESASWEAACASAGLHWIPFLTPTSPEEQVRRVGAVEGGFIYCVSVIGVTGARSPLPETVADVLGRVRAHSRRPVAVGFGVSGPEAARELARHADGVIVGSALLDRMEAAAGAGLDPVAAAAEFTAAVRKAMDDR